jgi:hypothetical protein
VSTFGIVLANHQEGTLQECKITSANLDDKREEIISLMEIACRREVVSLEDIASRHLRRRGYSRGSMTSLYLC